MARLKRVFIYTQIVLYIIKQPKKKSEILLFATTWMDLEDIMLSEISQKKTNTE